MIHYSALESWMQILGAIGIVSILIKVWIDVIFQDSEEE